MCVSHFFVIACDRLARVSGFGVFSFVKDRPDMLNRAIRGHGNFAEYILWFLSYCICRNDRIGRLQGFMPLPPS